MGLSLLGDVEIVWLEQHLRESGFVSFIAQKRKKQRTYS